MPLFLESNQSVEYNLVYVFTPFSFHYPSIINYLRIILEHLRSFLAPAFSQTSILRHKKILKKYKINMRALSFLFNSYARPALRNCK